jgi:hypothetical protein
MPARRDYTAAELQDRLDRQRRLTRERVARLRARRNAHTAEVTGMPVRVTSVPTPQGDGAPTAGNGHPSRTLPSPSLSKEIETIRTLLEPFADRGYEHDPDFWACMAAQFPGVALRVQAYKIASWLKKPLKKNRTALCSQGFIINWLEIATGDRAAARAAPRPAPEPPAPGMIIGGSYVQPQSLQGPRPDPPGLVHASGPMVRADRADYERAIAAGRSVPLPLKLARARGGAR